jgi:NDP-sugar pyrophosphorylase family protein
VKILGNVAIMDNAYISSGTVISGPAVIGRDVKIDKNTLIESSVLWDGSSIGKYCEVRKCVVGYGASVPSRTVIENRSVLHADKIKLNLSAIRSLLVRRSRREKN